MDEQVRIEEAITLPVHLSPTLTEYAKAFAKMQKDIKQPLKDANNPFFKSKYVPLENVVASIQEVAPKYGLSFQQLPSVDEHGLVEVYTMTLHESGEYIISPPLKMRPVKNDPQGIGSAITYAKRYQLAAIFGLASDPDDDGNQATFGNANPTSQPKPKIASKSNPKAKVTAKEIAEFEGLIEKLSNGDDSKIEEIRDWALKQGGVSKMEDMPRAVFEQLMIKMKNK